MRVGLLGCGVAMKHHISGILGFPGAKIVGLCDLNAEKAKAFGKIHNIKDIYTSFEELRKNHQLDVVHIMTPPKTHAALAIAAMDRGIHVLMEKPMAMTTSEADDMIRASKNNNVKLCIMHNHLFDPHILEAKKMIKNGILGDILYVNVTYSLDKDKMIEEGLINNEHWSHKLPMGIFSEYTPHLIYLFLSFLSEVTSVQASRNIVSHSRLDAINGLAIQLNTENGMGHISMLEKMSYGVFCVRIYGSKLAVHLNMMDLTMTIERERKLPKTAARMFSTVEQSFQNLLGTGRNITNILIGRLKRRPGHRMLIHKFYESIKGNAEVPVTGGQGREVVRIIELIHEEVKNMV
jgi:predicted dehydrogenase